MNACGFDRFDFYGCLDRVESAIAAQVRLRSGSTDLLSTFRSRPDWADNGFEQRVRRVKKAIDESQLIAIRNLQKKLGGINLQDIWPVLIEICYDMALFIGGSALGGGVAGAALGAFAFGVGAIPGAAAGAALGGKIGAMLLNFIGLKSVVEYMVDSIPLAISEYEKGFSDAWGPVPSLNGVRRDRQSLSHRFRDSGFAAEHFANGHEIIVVSLLMGIVAYLTRGKGDLKALVAEASAQARLGQKFAKWLQDNARKLTAVPMLQGRGQAGGQAISQASQTITTSKQLSGEAKKPAALQTGAELENKPKVGRNIRSTGPVRATGASKIVMRSSNELMGVEPASAELLAAVGRKRALEIAQQGSEALRMLDYFGAEASVGGHLNSSILLRQTPSKAALLEEFLHGTQSRLGIVDRLGTKGLGSAETHVKDFMIRHHSMLGLSAEDVRILKILRDKGL